jgi:hypothetical protein
VLAVVDIAPAHVAQAVQVQVGMLLDRQEAVVIRPAERTSTAHRVRAVTYHLTRRTTQVVAPVDTVADVRVAEAMVDKAKVTVGKAAEADTVHVKAAVPAAVEAMTAHQEITIVHNRADIAISKVAVTGKVVAIDKVVAVKDHVVHCAVRWSIQPVASRTVRVADQIKIDQFHAQETQAEIAVVIRAEDRAVEAKVVVDIKIAEVIEVATAEETGAAIKVAVAAVIVAAIKAVVIVAEIEVATVAQIAEVIVVVIKAAAEATNLVHQQPMDTASVRFVRKTRSVKTSLVHASRRLLRSQAMDKQLSRI